MENKRKVEKEIIETKDMVDSNIEDSKNVVEKEASVKSKEESIKKQTYKDTGYVLCRSVWSGGLHVTGSYGGSYNFSDYNAECDIEYRDLVYLIRKNSEHIFTPRFIIMDDDFLEEFPKVKELYETMYTPIELHKIIDLPIPKMRAEINKLPEAAKRTLLSLIATSIANGKLDSIKKVRTLSEIFDSDFNLLSELFGK